jgi:hypothetical protein
LIFPTVLSLVVSGAFFAFESAATETDLTMSKNSPVGRFKLHKKHAAGTTTLLVLPF